MYKPGDRVVYLAAKHSTHPTPRAEDLEPEQHGEGYRYAVRKYWVVSQIGSDGTLTVITRRGKQRVLRTSDDRLRLAKWWERWFLAGRFPDGGSGSDASTGAASAKQSVSH